jgi:hypothetical protein
LSYRPDAAAALTNRVVTWTLTARNSGALAAPVTVTLGVPFEQTLITGSQRSNIGALITHENRLEWLGRLGPGETLTATYRLTTSRTLPPLRLYGSATAATDRDVWQAGSYWLVMPFRTYLPVMRK